MFIDYLAYNSPGQRNRFIQLCCYTNNIGTYMVIYSPCRIQLDGLVCIHDIMVSTKSLTNEL